MSNLKTSEYIPLAVYDYIDDYEDGNPWSDEMTNIIVESLNTINKYGGIKAIEEYITKIPLSIIFVDNMSIEWYEKMFNICGTDNILWTTVNVAKIEHLEKAIDDEMTSILAIDEIHKCTPGLLSYFINTYPTQIVMYNGELCNALKMLSMLENTDETIVKLHTSMVRLGTM